MRIRSLACAAGLVLGAFCAPASAIIVLGGDGRNESDPGLPNIYVGDVGPFLGTTISPRHMVTAQHLNNATVGTTTSFVFNDGGAPKTYQMTAVAVENDLAIYELNAGQTSFVNYAPVWRDGGGEIGLPLLTIGRGTERGAPVLYPEVNGTQRGWRWGPADGLRSWGTNVVDDIDDTSVDYGPLLYFTFDSDGGANEGIFSANDSGGPVFIQDPDAGNVWKLAGINFSVDGDWSYDEDGPYFPAAIFDARGFYVGDANDNFLVDPDAPFEIPAGSYATQIAAHLGVIDAALASVPEPGTFAVAGLACLGLMFRRRR